MYVSPNYKTKKAVKDALKAGAVIHVYQPNSLSMALDNPSGEVFLEGSHYPEPHRWYAEGVAEHGRLIKIK